MEENQEVVLAIIKCISNTFDGKMGPGHEVLPVGAKW